MTSVEILLFIGATALVLISAVVWLTVRYLRYERRVARGRRSLNPVWKPFWMD